MSHVAPMTSVTVWPNTLKLFGHWALATVSLASCAAGSFVTTGLVVFLGAGIVIACLTTFFFLVAVIRKRPRVEIHSDGFELFSALGSRSRRYCDIQGDFIVFRLTGHKGICYRLTPEFRNSAGIKPAKVFGGNDEAVSGVFTVPLEEFAALLNARKRRSTAVSQAPSH